MTTAKKTISLKDKAIRAALDLAAERPWTDVTMQDIAAQCACTLGELHDVFEDRADILAAYERAVDRRVMDSVGKPDTDIPERDRVFEVIMERFDVLGEDRAALLSILESFRTDPKQAIIGLPHLGKSMVWMLECAGADANGPGGAVKALGLLGVYLYTLRAWMKDDSEDLSKTMAALDRALSRAEQWGGFILDRL